MPRKLKGTISQAVHIVLSQHDPLLADYILWVPYLDLNWRKFFLSVCQVGRTIEGNTYLQQQFEEALKYPLATSPGEVLNEEAILLYCSSIIVSSVTRSFVSSLLRCEISICYSGSHEAKEKGVCKEYRAAKDIKHPKINYSALVGFPAPWTKYDPMNHNLISQVRRFVDKFLSLLTQDSGPLYPQFQRNKNMSRESAQMLNEEGYKREGKMWRDFGTLDLERYYARTGIMVKGNCEMRLAWKYNELKPRCYYCIGGACYWPARFIKPLAVKMMNANPVTHTKRRTDPTSIRYSLENSDWIALWDLTSFTTSLCELRQFLFYLARICESDIRVRQRPLTIFDTYNGPSKRAVWELFDEYNESVNEYAEFTMMRLIDKEIVDMEVAETVQENSGMLGVPGNIGMSTALHGVHILPLVNKDKAVGVGDDEMAGVDEDPNTRLFPHIGELGDLQLTKTDRIPPPDDTSTVTKKFVKRGLTRVKDDLYIDKLFNFPLLAYGLNIQDPDRTVSFTDSEGVDKFLRQVGAYYWDIHEYGQYVDEGDVAFSQQIIGLAYRRWGIPTKGALPGYQLSNGFRILCAIPPIVHWFNPVYEDWAEWLWDNTVEDYALLPIKGGFSFPGPIEDEVFDSQETRMVVLLEAIGTVVKESTHKEWVATTEMNRRRFRESLKKDKSFSTIATYRYTSFIPKWLPLYIENASCTVPTLTNLGVYGASELQSIRYTL